VRVIYHTAEGRVVQRAEADEDGVQALLGACMGAGEVELADGVYRATACRLDRRRGELQVQVTFLRSPDLSWCE
jgi:hypothetical protein